MYTLESQFYKRYTAVYVYFSSPIDPKCICRSVPKPALHSSSAYMSATADMHIVTPTEYLIRQKLLNLL